MRNRYFLALLANLFIPLAGISTDIYLPSLPAMSHHFMVSKAMVQLTVVSFTLAMGLMQLVAGPLSDAWGRKKLFLGSVLIQLLAVVAILRAPSMTWIVFFRFIQGAGAAFLIVPARAVLSDLFEGVEFKKQFTYATITFALGPILGPFIGGYLQHFFGWQANFLFILGYGIFVLLLVVFAYVETCLAKRAFSITHLRHNYAHITKNKLFIFCCLFSACLFSATAFFNVAGPFFVQVGMGYSAVTFGHMALLIGVAWFMGNIANRALLHASHLVTIISALCLSFIAALAMLILSHRGHFNLVTLVIPVFCIVCANGFIFSLIASESMGIFKDLAASANALFFSMTWAGFSFFSAIATYLKGASLFPMAASLLGINVLCSLLYFIIVTLETKKAVSYEK